MTTAERQHRIHPDPLTCPRNDVAGEWTELRKAIAGSPALTAYRDALRLPGRHGIRPAVLDDLSTMYGYSPDECVDRCRNWEAWSLEEWSRRERESPEGLADFYANVESWSFDLLWYAYLQAEEYAYPVSAAIACSVGSLPPGTRLLDFGAGVGVTAQMFARLGFQVEMADVSHSLRAFAQHRLQRRGESIPALDLTAQELPAGRYGVITAIDTLVHVPDVEHTATMLHRALRPGGLLFANFDTRPSAPENHSFLYSDDRPLRRMLHRIGFEPEASLDGMITRYRRVEPAGPAHIARGVRDAVAFSPIRPVARRLKSRVQSVRR